jgi:hypothetical protein
MSADRDTPLFSSIEYRTTLVRLWDGLVYAASQMVTSPAKYLRVALLPDSFQGWLPVRVVREAVDEARSLVRSPLSWLRNAISTDPIGAKRLRVFWRVLAFSAVFHLAFIGYLLYVAIISPFASIRVVDRDYEKIDVEKLLAKLQYPRHMLPAPTNRTPMSLEEIMERQRKRREEMERRRREEAAREAERKRKEEEERKAAEEARAKAEQEKPATPQKFGEINIAPIRDIVGKIYEIYQAGELGIDGEKFSIMAGFKIEPDGSIPLKSINILSGSGSKVLDRNAIEILWRLGESRALGPLSKLSSQTIRLDVEGESAKLTITSFAASPEEAKSTAFLLNMFLGLMRSQQKDKSPNVAELLAFLKVTSNNKRVDARLSVPKSRASEMLKTQYASSKND